MRQVLAVRVECKNMIIICWTVHLHQIPGQYHYESWTQDASCWIRGGWQPWSDHVLLRVFSRIKTLVLPRRRCLRCRTPRRRSTCFPRLLEIGHGKILSPAAEVRKCNLRLWQLIKNSNDSLIYSRTINKIGLRVAYRTHVSK